MTASALKPQIKARRARLRRLDGSFGPLVTRGHYDRGRGIEPVGEKVTQGWDRAEREYRVLNGFGEGYVLNNYHQNQVYRLHVARLTKKTIGGKRG